MRLGGPEAALTTSNDDAGARGYDILTLAARGDGSAPSNHRAGVRTWTAQGRGDGGLTGPMRREDDSTNHGKIALLRPGWPSS